MEIAFFLVVMTVVVLAGTAVSERIGLPPPLLLVVVGVAGSFLPMVPEIELEADVVLLGLLPPLLYAAAVQTSLVDFNANRRPILLLSVGLVVFTAAGVAVVVAPAAARAGLAAGVRDRSGRRPARRRRGDGDRPPDRAAPAHRHDPGGRVAAQRRHRPGRAADGDRGRRHRRSGSSGRHDRLRRGRLRSGRPLGGLLVGFLVFVVVAWLRNKVTDPLLDTGISFVVPFAAYILAEKFHASGVVAVVIAGLLLGHKAPIIQTAQSRIAERMNWRTIAYILENTVFLLIGLQASWIIEDVSASEVPAGRIAALCAATLVAVIVLRMLWVFLARYLLGRPARPGDRAYAAARTPSSWGGRGCAAW